MGRSLSETKEKFEPNKDISSKTPESLWNTDRYIDSDGNVAYYGESNGTEAFDYFGEGDSKSSTASILTQAAISLVEANTKNPMTLISENAKKVSDLRAAGDRAAAPRMKQVNHKNAHSVKTANSGSMVQSVRVPWEITSFKRLMNGVAPILLPVNPSKYKLSLNYKHTEEDTAGGKVFYSNNKWQSSVFNKLSSGLEYTNADADVLPYFGRFSFATLDITINSGNIAPVVFKPNLPNREPTDTDASFAEKLKRFGKGLADAFSSEYNAPDIDVQLNKQSDAFKRNVAYVVSQDSLENLGDVRDVISKAYSTPSLASPTPQQRPYSFNSEYVTAGGLMLYDLICLLDEDRILSIDDELTATSTSLGLRAGEPNLVYLTMNTPLFPNLVVIGSYKEDSFVIKEDAENPTEFDIDISLEIVKTIPSLMQPANNWSRYIASDESSLDSSGKTKVLSHDIIKRWWSSSFGVGSDGNVGRGGNSYLANAPSINDSPREPL